MSPLRFTLVLVAALLVLGPRAGAEPGSGRPTAGSSMAVDHCAWSELLKQFTAAGPDGVTRVRYSAFKTQGRDALKSYLEAMQRIEPGKLERSEQMAFWINLYNAKTIDIILDHYPVRSIKDINLGGSLSAVFTGGPWKAQAVTVEGKALSLDDIEHGILRPLFHDPRVHYAINCASIGCPNLAGEAYTGATLEARLDAAARAYVNHPRGAKVESGRLTASSIYDWFKADFGGSDQGVLAHLRRYAGPELKRELESISAIAAFGYNWGLNDAH